MLDIYLICRFYCKCDENTAKILRKCTNNILGTLQFHDHNILIDIIELLEKKKYETC